MHVSNYYYLPFRLIVSLQSNIDYPDRNDNLKRNEVEAVPFDNEMFKTKNDSLFHERENIYINTLYLIMTLQKTIVVVLVDKLCLFLIICFT